jgi:hypothetical protein
MSEKRIRKDIVKPINACFVCKRIFVNKNYFRQSKYFNWCESCKKETRKQRLQVKKSAEIAAGPLLEKSFFPAKEEIQ